MAIFRFLFKSPKHQRYNYIPRYYDQDKEELESRLRKTKKLDSDDPQAVKARISGSFRRGSGGSSSDLFRRARNRQNSRSNLILVIAIITLLGLTYLVLSVYLPKIVLMLEG
jgi:hypothetical protein